MHKQLEWAGTVSNSKGGGAGTGSKLKRKGVKFFQDNSNEKNRWYNQRPTGQFMKNKFTVSL